jgi:hypothetical protein
MTFSVVAFEKSCYNFAARTVIIGLAGPGVIPKLRKSVPLLRQAGWQLDGSV